MALGSGEEVILTSEGVWDGDRRRQQVGVSKAHDADRVVPLEMRGSLEGPMEAKARTRKRVAFHPLGEVVATGHRK